ncbi:two-component regulator propeller domain-containing protein [uncultured Algibacter sp.]|uniref:hybrid sensor histidine kinase/response regulator transcription factor n=1 Tax=uncultured Algibacter sp. TaxID=298659 RepID=UPI002621C531|nr:two-component regulator propeller domain-containing protein [uncultured Algibacter sp.]
MKKTLFFTLFLLGIYNLLYTQNYYFKNYGVTQGLSHSTVFCSLQDQQGFLWFGTKNGLSRFDGKTFKVYQNNDHDLHGLKGNYIKAIHEFHNLMWVGTDKGLFSYNPKNEKFSVVENTQGFLVQNIENDSIGNLWFIANDAVYNYNMATKSLKNSSQDFFNNPSAIVFDKVGDMWVSSNGLLYKKSKNEASFVKYDITISKATSETIKISDMLLVDEHTLAIGTLRHGVVLFNLENKKTIKTLKDTNNLLYIRNLMKKGDELWIASESGILVYHLKNETSMHLTKDINNPYSISDNATYSLTLDREDGVWVGSYFGGVDYYSKSNNYFEKYFPIASKNSISGLAVREICGDNYNNIWIGTEDNGLNKYNKKTGVFTTYSSKHLSHYNIHGLLVRDNELWISVFENGVDVMDISSGKIKTHHDLVQDSDLDGNFSITLYETKSKDVFAATTHGVQRFNPKTEGFDKVDFFPEKYVYNTFLEDSNGWLWAGSSNGLYYYKQDTKEKGYFKNKEDEPLSISCNMINGVFEDSRHNIWITTENGLNLFNRTSHTFEIFNTKDGFPSDVFYAIIEDEHGLFWITTANGLVQFDHTNKEIITYTKANGILSNQFNYNSAFRDNNGKIFMGSINGMISFNPKEFTKNNFSPPVVITSLKVDNKDLLVDNANSPLTESITTIDKITLDYTQSTFSLDFAALGYVAPETTDYWYNMEGLNNNWISLNHENRAFFTELPIGDYTFNVKSKNGSGVWSSNTTSIQIEILPPILLSKIAYFIYALLIFMLIYFTSRFYHKQQKLKNLSRLRQVENKKEKELYQAKIDFFTNVSHEIRTPLSLIKGPLEKVLKKPNKDPEISDNLSIIEKNTQRLLNLVNELLDFRKTEMEVMSLSFIRVNVSALIKSVHGRFKKEIETKELDFVFEMDATDVYAHLDKEAVRKIISNLIGNAIKYADKKIIVSLKAENEFIEFCIKNDGNLVPEELKDKIFDPFYRLEAAKTTKGTGIGLSLALSLSEMHNGSLSLDTTSKTMNVFVLKLPKNQENRFHLYDEPENENNPDIETNTNSENDTIADSIIKILVVEDNLDLLDFVTNELDTTYHVIKCSSAEEALTKLDDTNIGLVISDVNMPGMDGFTFCNYLKTSIAYSHIPIILLTAKTTLASKVEGLESGADAYIEKPFSMDFLKVRIHNLLENRKHIVEHYTTSPLAHILSIANTKTDKTFIEKLDKTIDENMSDPNLNVETLSEIMFMSRSTLYRKIDNISSLSPNELINISRLKKAALLLSQEDYKIYEVAEMVGYNSKSSFGRNFQKQFNMTPTEYKKTLTNTSTTKLDA